MPSVLPQLNEPKSPALDALDEAVVMAYIKGYQSGKRAAKAQPAHTPFPFSLLEKGVEAVLRGLEVLAQQLVQGLEALLRRLAGAIHR